MPSLFETLSREGVPLTRIDTIMAAYSADELDAGVREHFKKIKGGASMKCGLCGKTVAHPSAAQAHMADIHMKELKSCALKGRMKALGMKVGHRLPNPSMGNIAKNGTMGHRFPNTGIKYKKARNAPMGHV